MSTQWTITAKRRLRAALAEELCEACDDVKGKEKVQRCQKKVDETIADLNAFLKETFPLHEIVVEDMMWGFRPKKRQHTLLVEVLPPAAGETGKAAANKKICNGTYVVKIGPAATLEE
jgi:hypothetical protein